MMHWASLYLQYLDGRGSFCIWSGEPGYFVVLNPLFGKTTNGCRLDAMRAAYLALAPISKLAKSSFYCSGQANFPASS